MIKNIMYFSYKIYILTIVFYQVMLILHDFCHIHSINIKIKINKN